MSTNHLLRILAGAVLCLAWPGTDARGQAPFVRGDVNCDGTIDINDVNAINNFLFGGVVLPCDDAADVNDDGLISIMDVNALTSFINFGLPTPAPPYPLCGFDPTLDALTCMNSCCGTVRDHFQAWRLVPQTFNLAVNVRDQFMTDQIQLVGIEYLSNPASKDLGPLLRPEDHLTWYRATGRDTLLTVVFYNQFGQDTVEIDAVTHLLLPTQKFPHPPPSPLLDHYKAYRIRNPQTFIRPTQIQDQFSPDLYTVDQLTPRYFLTPADKNGEGIRDTVTHYVAYDIFPKVPLATLRTTLDQFGQHTLEVNQSDLLLVPTYKLSFHPPTPNDTLKNHYKSWRVEPPAQFTGHVVTEDQFKTDQLFLSGIEYLSNPAHKDTSGIRRPDDHLNWYKAIPQTPTLLRVEFENQFQRDTITIGSVTHLLVPCRKDPHPRPDSLLGHYTSYEILNGEMYRRTAAQGPVTISDQFDVPGAPELIDSLLPRFFLTPARKNQEPQYGSDTHYVAYEIFPKTILATGPIRITEDQFGVHDLPVFQSELLLVPSHKITWGPPTPVDTLKNHYKSWRINPPAQFSGFAVVQDQFKEDQLFLNGIEFLSNPAHKDTSAIRRPNDHLNWYRAVGHPTLLQVVYENQFNRDTIIIDSVTHLLVPCRKDPHPAPDSLLGHYTSYRITNGKIYRRSDGNAVQIQDQFDLVPEFVDSLMPRYFLTPAIKNGEPAYGSDTHYVAYEIYPKTIQLPPVPVRLTEDQFGLHQLPVANSELLLVPSRKVSWGPPPVDTVKNHYQGWRLDPTPFNMTAQVVDQFMSDVLKLDSIEYLANPAQKNNEPIILPDDHLLWYSADGRDTCVQVVFSNQFGLDTFVVGTVSYLILPAQKLPHNPPSTTLDHYKAYQVFRPQSFTRVTTVMDQFTTVPFTLDRLTPLYLCLPASKNGEVVSDTVTHYVAYDFIPKQNLILGRTVVDQFGSHDVRTLRNELLMVPTRKLEVKPYCPITTPGSVNCDNVVNSSDIITLVNYVFKGGVPPCPCPAAGDIDCNGTVTSADIIKLVNYVFKSGPAPCDPCTIIPSLWRCPC